MSNNFEEPSLVNSIGDVVKWAQHQIDYSTAEYHKKKK